MDTLCRVTPIAAALVLVMACRADGPDVILHPVAVTPGSVPLPSTPTTPSATSTPSPGSTFSTPSPGSTSSTPSLALEPGSVSLTSTPSQASRALTWTAPAHWIPEEPGGPLRLAQWQIPGSDGGPSIICAVYSFEGGGSADQNITRWLDQFSQPDPITTRERALVEEISLDGLAVSIVTVAGTYSGTSAMGGGSQRQLPNWALFGAIFQTARPYFLKCLGPETSMNRERQSMRQFLNTFHPTD